MKWLIHFLILAFLNGSAFGAGKDYVPGFVLINAVSMGSNITSNPIDTRGWDNVDLELVASGSPTGTFFVDCTLNAQQPPAPTSPKWVAITLPAVPVVTGSPSNIIIELLPIGCMFLRVRYVFSSGSGTLTAYASEKQI